MESKVVYTKLVENNVVFDFFSEDGARHSTVIDIEVVEVGKILSSVLALLRRSKLDPYNDRLD